MLQRVENENMTRLVEVLESQDNFYLISELMDGGSLQSKLNVPGFHFGEAEVANITRQVL